MKLTVWACTDKVGSNVERSIEIPDEDMEGMDERDKAAYIEDWCKDEMLEMIEWGYREEN